MAKLLGIDVGTSSTKAVLIDETGRVIKQASAEYPLHAPQPTWAEQHPADWAKAIENCVTEIGETKPDAIGLTGQMHGMVALDASDQVVRPAILWCDQRTERECEEIDATLGADAVRSITGNPPLTGFQLPKVLWMRNHEPENFARTKSVLLPKDYVRFLLTGEKATDASDASGVGALDLKKRGWWIEGIEALNLDPSMFPKLSESHEQTGNTDSFAPLDKGIPVVAGAGDQAAGAVGTGAVKKGIVSVSLGTSGVVFSSLERPEPDPTGAAHVFCHANRRWHAMGVMLSCGGAVRWARDAFLQGKSFSTFDQEAGSVAAGCEGLTFLPYLTGERCPHNDPLARGAFAGLTLSHTRAHLARAVLEGATFGLADCLVRLASLGVTVNEVRVTGGGARSDLWMQLLTDVLHTSCVRIEGDDGPAFGAALLAGVGIGIWPDVQSACVQTVKFGKQFEPSGVDYSEALARYRSLYPQVRAWTRG